MTRDEFLSHVISMGIDERCFALDQWTEEDAFNLVAHHGEWLVFWCEAGRGPLFEKRFDTESAALEYLLSKLSPIERLN